MKTKCQSRQLGVIYFIALPGLCLHTDPCEKYRRLISSYRWGLSQKCPVLSAHSLRIIKLATHFGYQATYHLLTFPATDCCFPCIFHISCISHFYNFISMSAKRISNKSTHFSNNIPSYLHCGFKFSYSGKS